MSPASHIVSRLRKLYGVVLGREQLLQRPRPTPSPCHAVPSSHAALEQLEQRLLLANPGLDPVLLIPGFGGVMPSDNVNLEDWLTHPGCPPDQLQVDPLAHVYDDLIQSLKNVGYVEGQTLFVANWDWRVPVALQDGTADGHLSAPTAAGITNSVYETGLDYLGYWLDQAVQAWAVVYPDQPLTKVDIVAHSTGGLVARSYIQSAAYGAQYKTDGNGDPVYLPQVDDLVLAGVPNLGAGDVWSILHDDFNASIATRGLGLIAHAAYDQLEQGHDIVASDGTTMFSHASLPTHEQFIAQYVGSAHDLLPEFAFVDDLLNGQYAVPSGPYANTLLQDLNHNGPATFVDPIDGDLTVVYGASEDTIGGVRKHTGISVTLLPVVQNFDELLGHRTVAGEAWYEEVKASPGDGTVTRNSALWELTEGPGVHLAVQPGVGHRGLMSDLQSQKTIVSALGVTGYADADIAHAPAGGDSGLMQLATSIFNEQAAFDGLAGGIEDVFGEIQDGVNSTLGSLPIIGPAFLDHADSFFRDIGTGLADVVAMGPSGIVAAAQQGVFSLLGSWLKDVNGDGLVNSDDVAIGLVDGALEFHINAGGVIAGTSVDIGFDVGLDALGLDLSVEGGLDLAVTWSLDLGFGVVFDGLTPRFYVSCGADRELELTASVSLQEGTTLSGKLGFLQLTAADFSDPDDVNTPGHPTPNASGRTGVYGQIGLDVREPGDYLPALPKDGRLFASELEAISARQAFAGVLDVGADVNLHLVTGFGGSAVFPSIRADLDIDWDFLQIDTGLDGEEMLNRGRPGIVFNHVTLDLGSFLNDFVGPVLHTIHDVLDPIMPLVDALRAPVPVITELGEYIGGLGLNYINPMADRKAGISIYDMASAIQNIKPDPRLGFVLAIIDVIDVIDQVSSVTADGLIDLGSLTLMSPTGTSPDIRRLSDLMDYAPEEVAALNSVAQLDTPGGTGAKSFLKKALSAAGQIIKFPILTDPMQAFNLLMGKDATLIYLDIPALDFKFAFGQGIPIFPPVLKVNLGGTFEAYANLDFGFDTYGLRKFKESGDVLDIFDGFYVDDHVVDGVDQPEAMFKASLNAGALVSAVLAAAEVDGGIEGTLSADLVDIDPDGDFTRYQPDGKIRPSEIAQLLAFSPMAFFNLSGKITYYFHAWVGVGIIVDLGLFSIRETLWEKEWNLASGTLVEFKLETPFPAQNPVLGEVQDGVLRLNMGPRAAQRLYGNTSDGSENFAVSFSEDDDAIVVSAMGGTQSFPAAGIRRIEANGGSENDTITLSTNVPSRIEVLLQGGAGDDTLKAFGGWAWDGDTSDSVRIGLYGDDGNDLLQGGDGPQSLDGGTGNDRLLGGDGSDYLRGGPGRDYLRGDGGDDTVCGDADDEGIYGGAGNDCIYVCGTGGSAWRVPVDGGFGDDQIVVRYANLNIVGGYGQNLLLLRDDGESGSATLTLTRDPARGDAGSLVVQRAGAVAESIAFTDVNVSLGISMVRPDSVAGENPVPGNNLTVLSALDVPLTITGGAGDDAIALAATKAPTTVDLAGAGTDCLTLGTGGSLLAIESSLTVRGGSEAGDRLVLDLSTDDADQTLTVDAAGTAPALYTVAGVPLKPGIFVDYDGQVDTIELRLGDGTNGVTAPQLGRSVVVRGGTGADRADATLANAAPAASLTTFEVETVGLVDCRTGTSYDWKLAEGPETGRQLLTTGTGAIVLDTTGANTNTLRLSAADDAVTVLGVARPITLDTGGGADTVSVGLGSNRRFDQILAATLTLAGGAGSDTLALYDTPRLDATAGVLGAESVTGFGMAAGTSLAYSGFEIAAFTGGIAAYTLTLAGMTADAIVTLEAGADVITVRGASGSTTLNTGGGSDRVTVDGAGRLLTVAGGSEADTLVYAPPAGAAGNLILGDGTVGQQGQIGLGSSGVITETDAVFKEIEQITFELPESNDALTLNYTFACAGGVQVNGHGGNDVVTAKAIGGYANLDGGAGYDTLGLDLRNVAPKAFPGLSFAAGLELLLLDNSGYSAAVHWTAAAGEIRAGALSILNTEGAADTRILAGASTDDTLTIEEASGRPVDATLAADPTIAVGRVELLSGAQVLTAGHFSNPTYQATTDILDGVADVTSFGDDVYAACTGSSSVETYRRLPSGVLRLLQVFTDGVAGISSLAGANRIVISADGQFVYVSAPGDSAISVFSRAADTGKLTFVQAVLEGQTSVACGTANGSFETGTFAGWNTLGAASVQTAAYGDAPTDGTHQALITTGTGSVPYSSMESFLGYYPGQDVYFADDFDDGNMDGWDAYNESYPGESHWTVTDGHLREDSDFYAGGSVDHRLGTYVRHGIGGARDYELSASLFCGDNDGIGLIFRWDYFDTYYKLEMDKERSFRKLFKVVGGVESLLWSDSGSYTTWTWFDAMIRVTTEPGGARMQAYIGTTQLFDVLDPAPIDGSAIALYSWGMGLQYDQARGGAWFDNIVVRRPQREGSAIAQTVTVPAGTVLSFDWRFLTDLSATPNSQGNDYAFFSVTPALTTLADSHSVFATSPTVFNMETQVGTYRYAFPTSGTYTIGMGVVDVGGTAIDSGLLIDRVTYTLPPAADGLSGVADIAIAGDQLFAASAGDNALAVFNRRADGGLEFRQMLRDTASSNVALHKSAAQSSVFGNYAGADRAVDGNTAANWISGDANSITHTGNDLNAWWEVYLGACYSLDRIQLYDRAGFPGRLSNLYVIVYDDGTEVYRQLVDHVSTSGGGNLLLKLPAGIGGDRVRLQFNGYNNDGNGYMNLAECMVYGKAFTGLTALTSVTVSADGTRVYTTNSSGKVTALNRTASGNVFLLGEMTVTGIPTDAAEATSGGRRLLGVTTQSSALVQTLDLTYGTVNLDLRGAFNADLVTNSYYGTIDSTQDGWQTQKYGYITQTAATQLAGPSGQGLPDNGLYTGTSLGVDVQLAYRDDNNAIFLQSTTPTVAVSLPAGSQSAYGNLYLLGASAWGDTVVHVTLRYGDNTSQTINVTFDDWGDDGTQLSAGVLTLINSVDNYNSTSGLYNGNDTAIFAVPVTVDSSRTLVGIDLVRLSGSSACILGAVGQVAAVPIGSTNPNIGPLRAIEPFGGGSKFWVMGQGAVAGLTPDPVTHIPALYRTVPWSGSSPNSNPTAFHVPSGHLGYVVDSETDTLRTLELVPPDVPAAASWTYGCYHPDWPNWPYFWYSPAPTTVTTNIDDGVQFVYSAASGGWATAGTSKVRMSLTTTATEAAHLVLDIGFSGWHGWSSSDTRYLSVILNGYSVQTLALSRAGYFDDFFNDFVLDVNAGDTYGIQITASNRDLTNGFNGKVSIVRGDVNATPAVQSGPVDIASAGLTGVTISPDGRFAYAVNPTAGAVVAMAVDGDGALSAIQAIADYTCINGTVIEGLTGATTVALDPSRNSLYVLSPSAGALNVFDRDPVVGSLTFRQRVSLGAGATGLAVSLDGAEVYTSGPAGLAIWTRQTDGTLATTPMVRTLDGASDWVVRAAATDPDGAALPDAVSWSTTLTTLVNRGTYGPTTSVDDAAGGVSFYYSARNRGSGTSTLRYDFTTTATEDAVLSLDLRYAAVQGYYGNDWGLEVIQNGAVVQSLSLGSDIHSKNVAFNDITLNVAAGDTYGVRVLAGTSDRLSDSWGTVTLVARRQMLVLTSDALGMARVLVDSPGGMSVKGDIAGIGHTSDLAVSPDGLTMYLTDPAAGALRVLERDAGGVYVLRQTFQEGQAGLRGMGGPSGVAMSPSGDFLYVTAKSGDALVAFRRNDATHRFELAQVLRNGAGTAMGLKAPDSLAVDPVTGRIYVGSLAGVGQNTGGLATLDVATGPAGEARTRFAFSFSGIEHLGLTTGDGNDTIRVLSTPTGIVESTLNTGGADDLVTLSQFAGVTTVNTGGGADTVDIRVGTPGASLTVNTEADADSILLAGTAAGSTTTINGGDGPDVIRVSGGALAADVTVNGGDPITTPGDTLLFDAGVGSKAQMPAAGAVRAARPEYIEYSGCSLAADGDLLTLHGPMSQYVDGTWLKFNGKEGEVLPSASPALAWDTNYYLRRAAGASGNYTYTLYDSIAHAVAGGPDGLIAIDGGVPSLTVVVENAPAFQVSYTGIDEPLVEIALPVPDAGVYTPISEGQGITLSAIGTQPAAGRAVAYSWDIDGDGVFGDRTGPTASLTWADLVEFGLGDDGPHVVWARVTDVSAPTGDAVRDSLIGQSVDDAATITILNVPPTVTATGTGHAEVGQSYAVGFAASDDPDADTVSGWRVTWGDGTAPAVYGSDVSQATHAYLTTGNYTVTVTAFDEDYTEAEAPAYSATHLVHVDAPPPAISTAGAGGTLTIREGEGVSFLATAPGAPTFAWTLNGSALAGASGACAALTWEQFVALGVSDSGAYPVTVQGTYADYDNPAHLSQSTIATASLVVVNVAPSARFISSTQAPAWPIFEGGSATVSFADPQDPSPADQTGGWRYSYDFGADGSFEIADSPAAVAAVPAGFAARDGLLPVRGRILDKDGGATDYLTSVAIRNAAPTVTLNSVSPIAEGEEATLSGVLVDPGVFDAFTLTVDWGDGSQPQEFQYPAGTHTFSRSHTYGTDPANDAAERHTIRVTVDDGDGGRGVAQAAVVVSNVAPHLEDLQLTALVAEGVNASLTGTFTDPGTLDVHAVTVDWGDGSPARTEMLPAGIASFQLPHAYPDNGVYPVHVAVRDEDGGMDQSGDGLHVTVTNIAPVLKDLSVTPTLEEGDTAVLSGRIVDSGENDTFTLALDWGDGSPSEQFNYPAGTTTFSLVHRYADDSGGQPYSVSLTLTDDDGGIATDGMTLAVGNVVPTVRVTLPDRTAAAVVDEGGTVTLLGTAQDPGLHDSVTVSIDWGDGTTDTIDSWTPVGFVVDTEDNGSLGGANDLASRWIKGDGGELQTRISGEVGLGGDVDYYRFQAVAGDTIRVDLARSDQFPNDLAPADPVVNLLDGEGNLIAAAINTGEGLSAILEHDVTADGSYYLQVAATHSNRSVTYELATSLAGPSACADALTGNCISSDGRRSFAATHQYPVDPSGVPSGDYQIQVTVSDADGGAAGNTLDVFVAPTSQVAALPAIVSPCDLVVSWSGRDAGFGGGIASYDVYVSDNGGAYIAWLTGTSATSATFTGQRNHIYSFYSRARDGAGHLEAAPASPDATTRVTPAEVVGRLVFYNNSLLDGSDPEATPADDDAIDDRKSALLPGGTATTANLTDYIGGINGVMVDVAGLPGDTSLSPTDFAVRVSNASAPGGWELGPNPTSVTVRRGEGTDSSDRITILWADGAIQSRWLELTVPSGSLTGLSAPDVFSFGNLPGDANSDGIVDQADYTLWYNGYGASGRELPGDFTADGLVDQADYTVWYNSYGTSLPILSPMAEGSGGADLVLLAATDTASTAPAQPEISLLAGSADLGGTALMSFAQSRSSVAVTASDVEIEVDVLAIRSAAPVAAPAETAGRTMAGAAAGASWMVGGPDGALDLMASLRPALDIKDLLKVI